MIWKFDNKIRDWLPRLQSHRGFWVKGCPENSIDSISQAFELGYEMSEFDVRITKDNVIILFHDALLNGKKISQLTYAQIKEQTSVSTLEELFIWFSQVEKFKLNIEIKNDGLFNLQIEKKVCGLIADFNLESRVMISSFNPFSLAKVRRFNDKIYRALLLTFKNEHGNNLVIKSGVLNYLCYPHVLHLRWQDYLRFKGNFQKLSQKIPVVLWTVNNLEFAKSVESEIHGVISDEITPNQIY